MKRKRLSFNDLEKGGLYGNRDGCEMMYFIEMYNNQLAEFVEAEYDEEKGDYLPMTTSLKSANIHRLTRYEVSHLKRW